MTGTWREPARDIPVVARPDVLVVGAGSAGIAAAVAAARRGADTMLLEATCGVGGLATYGLVNLLLTLDDGEGTQVVAGLCQEVVDRLVARGDAIHPPASRWGSEDPADIDRWRRWGLVWGAPENVRYSVAFDPEAFADVALDLVTEAGARLRFQTWFAGVGVRDGSVEAVLVESKRGREAIVPRVVVDATGDADVAVAAGAPTELVRIPPHLWFRVGGVTDDPSDAPLAFRTTGAGRALIPWGPWSGRVDACDPDEVTAALLACRAEARATFDALVRDVPAYASAWLDGYASMLGITESRRLVGAHQLAREDGDVRFADGVARTGHWTRRGVVWDVPLRCLVAPGLDDLLVAGRCISTTRYVHQATKEIPAAMATGEAAGAAAAHVAGAGGSVHTLDVTALRSDLAAGGAIV